MNLLGGFIIAFSMYSKIPMPRLEWTKGRMRYAMCFFPLVGAVTGGLLCLLAFLAFRTEMGGGTFALFGTALPLLVTGGIHMDGFLDVTDARSSYGEKEKKLSILKDPHTGAFAIIGLGIYILLYAGAFMCLKPEAVKWFASSFVLTRALSGLSVVTFPMAKKDGLAATFSGMAVKRTVGVTMLLYLLVSGGFLVYAGGVVGVACLTGAALTFFWYYRMAVKEFGGITGDLAGYFLQLCELVILLMIGACSLIGI